jgi:hypothetical protein
MILRNEFTKLQILSGTDFTVDACCNSDGPNSHCHQYCSRAQNDALQFDFTGHHSWFNPPFSNPTEVIHFIKHYQVCKAKAPDTTSACFLLPKWTNAPWAPFISDMHVMHSYPKGYRLFSMPSKEHPLKRQRMAGIPWAVQVFHDPVRPAVLATACSTPVRPTMLFDGMISGVPGVVLADTGATGTAYISSEFC